MEEEKKAIGDVLAKMVNQLRYKSNSKKTVKKKKKVIGKVCKKAVGIGVQVAGKTIQAASKGIQLIGRGIQGLGQAVSTIPIVGKFLGAVLGFVGKATERIGDVGNKIGKQIDALGSNIRKSKDKGLDFIDKSDQGLVVNIKSKDIIEDVREEFKHFQGTIEDIKYFSNNNSISFADIKAVGNLEKGLDSEVFKSYMDLAERGCLKVNVNNEEFSKSTFSITDKGKELIKEADFSNATKHIEDYSKDKLKVKDVSMER